MASREKKIEKHLKSFVEMSFLYKKLHHSKLFNPPLDFAQHRSFPVFLS